MSLRKEQGRACLDIFMILILTIIVGTVLIAVCGADPIEAYGLFFRGMFGTTAGTAEIFVKACPLILTGLGCALAYRTGFFNIGAEGQFYVGAMTGTMVVLNLPLPGVYGILLAMAVGFLAGGLWALAAAFFKARFNISEIIVTIMMNYIAVNFLGYAVRSFLQTPDGNVPESAKVEEFYQLKKLIPGTRFHAGIVIAFVCVILIWILLEKTTFGYELKAVGLNKRASACCGISVMKNIVLSAFLSGGLSAIAGVIEVLAIQKKLMEGISSNCGYTAVLIALIAFNHPLGVLAAAVLYSAMQVGASSMQRQLGVPSSIVNILIGVIVILILCKDVFHRLYSKKKENPEEILSERKVSGYHHKKGEKEEC